MNYFRKTKNLAITLILLLFTSNMFLHAFFHIHTDSHNGKNYQISNYLQNSAVNDTADFIDVLSCPVCNNNLNNQYSFDLSYTKLFFTIQEFTTLYFNNPLIEKPILFKLSRAPPQIIFS